MTQILLILLAVAFAAVTIFALMLLTVMFEPLPGDDDSSIELDDYDLP